MKKEPRTDTHGMLDLIEPLRQHVAHGESLAKRLLSVEPLPFEDAGWCKEVRASLPLFLDLGMQAQVYEVCEGLVQQPASQQPAQALLVQDARIFLAHLDSLRKRALPDCRVVFLAQLSAAQAWLQAHGHFGMGLLQVFAGDLEDALLHFQKAHERFLADGEEVFALKARIREVSALRLLTRYPASTAVCEDVLRRALDIGVAAFSPLMCAMSSLGSDAAEQGRFAEALRHLRECARLARVLPRTPATAFSMLQYGNALARVGRHSEAVGWLERADDIQRVLDPIARPATLFKLAQSFRELGRLSEARQAILLGLGSRLAGIDPEDFFDVQVEAMKVFLACHDEARAESLLAEARARVDGARLPRDRELPAILAGMLETWRMEWESISQTPAGAGFLAVDFHTRKVLWCSADGELRDASPRSDAGAWVCLALLAECPAGVPRERILEEFCRREPEEERRNLLRRIRRAKNLLSENGLALEDGELLRWAAPLRIRKGRDVVTESER